MSILDAELRAALDASVADVAHAVTLPPALYTSAEALAFEKDAVFMREWCAVGRADRIPEPGDWFTYEIEVRDDVWRGRNMTRIKITVNGKELYEYLDIALTFGPGHFAFQQHDPGSHVSIRKVEVMPLAD